MLSCGKQPMRNITQNKLQKTVWPKHQYNYGRPQVQIMAEIDVANSLLPATSNLQIEIRCVAVLFKFLSANNCRTIRNIRAFRFGPCSNLNNFLTLFYSLDYSKWNHLKWHVDINPWLETFEFSISSNAICLYTYPKKTNRFCSDQLSAIYSTFLNCNCD